MIVLRLVKSWYGKEDRQLTEILMKELPGILWWAIAGWKRLRERGRLLQPESGAEVLSEWEDLASPIGAFLRERCQVGSEHSVARADLYAAYQDWCEEKGRKHVADEAGFGRDLHAAVPGLRTSRPRLLGKQVRHYAGVGLQRDGF